MCRDNLENEVLCTVFGQLCPAKAQSKCISFLNIYILFYIIIEVKEKDIFFHSNIWYEE